MHELERRAGREVRLVAAVGPIGRDQRVEVGVVVGKAARVVQELAQRDAFGDRPDLLVESQRTLVDELEDDRGDECLRHASDQESVLGCHGCTGRRIGNACCALPGEIGTGRHDSARDAGSYDCL